METSCVAVPAEAEWATPILLVPKRYGSLRFRVDYRRSNAATVGESYPIPCMVENFESLGKARLYSTLVANSGYWQIKQNKKAP